MTISEVMKLSPKSEINTSNCLNCYLPTIKLVLTKLDVSQKVQE